MHKGNVEENHLNEWASITIDQETKIDPNQCLPMDVEHNSVREIIFFDFDQVCV